MVTFSEDIVTFSEDIVTLSEDIVTFSGDIVTLFEARVTLSEDGLIVVKLIFHLPRPTSDCQSQQKYQKY